MSKWLHIKIFSNWKIMPFLVNPLYTIAHTLLLTLHEPGIIAYW